MKKTLRYGQVGGSLDAFIGAVHRIGASFDGRAVLAAGCFSGNEEKNRRCGAFLRLDEDRIYSDYETMARAEAARNDGIDFVVVSTPNNTHFDIARAFLREGINVLCEKPLCFEVEQGLELRRLAAEKGLKAR